MQTQRIPTENFLRTVRQTNVIHGPTSPIALFLNHQDPHRFGVGKNMAATMRHWATSSNIITEDEDKDNVTTFKRDMASLAGIHYGGDTEL
ncbi:MAG: DUF4007 family protein [Deltaproteobacteria bacterium]|nr:MAG: DUF4007 family protein [Deltaproteobacteria bacterium]